MAQRRSNAALLGVADLEQEKCDYRAAKRSTRLRPRPRGIPTQGAPADYHLRSDADHLWIGELGMEFDRNDLVAKRLLDVQETNVLQDGFQYDPQTGDKKLDQDLKEWWTEHSETPSSIDAQSQWGFNRITRFLYRGMKAAGDIWPILRADGLIETAEFYRVRSPTRKVAENVVLGVELDGDRKRQAAWFTKDVIPALSRQAITKGELKRIAVYHDDDPLGSADDDPRALQLFDPTRMTATRGVSAFAPVFDFLGIHGDLQFVMLVKSQMSNMVLLLRQRAAEFNPEYLTAAPVDGTSPALSSLCRDFMTQELRPGAQIGSLPGETISLASSNVPNPEFFAHMKLVLALCGVAFYIPLVQLLLDASETNFSGYRGAISEARMKFKQEQSDLVAQWHRPVMWFQLDRLAERDPAIAKARDGRYGRNKVNLYRHRWKCPRWAYIQPVEDATAALIRRANTLTSPRRQCTEDGVGDWEEIFVETIDDHFAAMDYAYEQASALIAKHNLSIEIDLLAARLLPLPNPERTQISVSSQIGPEAAPAKPAKNAPAK